MLAYTPTYPASPPAAAAEAPAPRPLDTQAGLGYALRSQAITLEGARVDGMIDNVVSVGGQFRSGDWLLGVAAWRLKAPVSATTFDPASNPALSPEMSEIRLRAGYVLAFAGPAIMGMPLAIEVAPGLGLLSFQSEPGGRLGIPLTGTPLDYSQLRRGLGLEVPAAAGLGEVADVVVRGSYYPSAEGRMDRAPYGFNDRHLDLIELGAGLRFRLFAGLDADLSALSSTWAGQARLEGTDQDFRDLALTYTAGLVYRPERVGR